MDANRRKEPLNPHSSDLPKVYYMFHKPAGCITARKDERHRTVMDYFDGVNQDGLFPVGRLDKDTEGLLFLTNDGAFNHQLMHPDKHVPKTYYFCGVGSLQEQDIQNLEQGMLFEKDGVLTKPARFQRAEEVITEEIKSLITRGKNGRRQSSLMTRPITQGYLTISEGRKHQVKRMLKAVGCRVVYLKRISVGKVRLDETLKKGTYRLLREEEITILIEG